MRPDTWLYYLRETALSLRRNTWMAFASMSVVAVTMLIFGAFLLLLVNLNFMTREIESDVEISVFLNKNVKAEHLKELESRLKSLPGTAEIRFVSKEEALKTLQKEMQWEEGDLAVVGENPLPDAYYVKAESPEAVGKLAASIAKLPEVEDVRYGKEVVEKLFNLTKALRYAGVLVIVGLAFAAVFIISNTIKLTVFSRRREIFIMKSVGATNWFIRWPFILEGLVLGLAGGAAAALALRWAYAYLLEKVNLALPFLTMVNEPQFLTRNYWTIIVMGAALGILGSGISLRKFLRRI